MERVTIKAGQWIITEGGLPGYFIYKMLQGRVSVFKGAKKIRDMEIAETDTPILLGIVAALSNDRLHTASVRAETDVLLEKTSIDQIRGVLANEIPAAVKHEVATMIRTMVTGNRVVAMLNELSEEPRIDLQIPDGVCEETMMILRDVKRLYRLITADIDRLQQK